MQIVIDIPEKFYEDYKLQLPVLNKEVPSEFAKYAIATGIPLPKGHWIHRTQDGGYFWEECSVCHTKIAYQTKHCPECGTYMYADIRTDAPTIIEATNNNNDYTWAKELIKRTGLSIAPEDGSKPYGYD